MKAPIYTATDYLKDCFDDVGLNADNIICNLKAVYGVDLTKENFSQDLSVNTIYEFKYRNEVLVTYNHTIYVPRPGESVNLQGARFLKVDEVETCFNQKKDGKNLVQTVTIYLTDDKSIF